MAFANPAKEKLQAGAPIVGFNIFECLRPSLARVLAQTGYDFVLVETEHIQHDPQVLGSFLLVARNGGLAPIVTIPSVSRTRVSRMLDAGASGVCLCHAETGPEVDELVRLMKYPPDGERALAHGPNADYAIGDVARYCRDANQASLLALKIESRKGVDNAADMLARQWVDAVLFGPGDLAADMGLHGQWSHPAVVAAIESVIDVAIARGIAVEAAETATDRVSFERQRARGIRIFGPTRSTEYDALRAAAERLIEPYR